MIGRYCLPLVYQFLSSLYLSSASQVNVGCYIMTPPSLGPAFCVLSAPATAMACIAALVASATAYVITSLVFVCSLAIVHMCTLSAYVLLYETFPPDTYANYMMLCILVMCVRYTSILITLYSMSL